MTSQLFFGTETTGRDRWNEPCEVEACTKDEENDSFQTYILLNKEISASAAEVNRFTKRNGKLFFRDGEVHAETLETAIKIRIVAKRTITLYFGGP